MIKIIACIEKYYETNPLFISDNLLLATNLRYFELLICNSKVENNSELLLEVK